MITNYSWLRKCKNRYTISMVSSIFLYTNVYSMFTIFYADYGNLPILSLANYWRRHGSRLPTVANMKALVWLCGSHILFLAIFWVTPTSSHRAVMIGKNYCVNSTTKIRLVLVYDLYNNENVHDWYGSNETVTPVGNWYKYRIISICHTTGGDQWRIHTHTHKQIICWVCEWSKQRTPLPIWRGFYNLATP